MNDSWNDICFVGDEHVTFPKEDNRLINEKILPFVKEMSKPGQSIDLYAACRKANKIKAQKDNLIAKKSEYMVAKFMSSRHGFPFMDIDLEVRTGKKKGWKPDLPYNEINPTLPIIHVKSLDRKSLEIIGDYSWTFQLKNEDDDGGRDPILDIVDPGEFVALVYIHNFECHHGIIKAIVPAHILVSQKFLKDPVFERYFGIKKCVYFENILDDKDCFLNRSQNGVLT